MTRTELHPGDRVRVRATGQIGTVKTWFSNGHAFVEIRVELFPAEPRTMGALYHRSELEKLAGKRAA